MPISIPTPLLIIVALLLVLAARPTRPRLSAVARRGIQATLSCYHPALTSQDGHTLAANRDGLAVALLLLNAAAKANPALYAYKVALLRALVDASGRDDWWAERHDHPETTSDTGTVAIFVETTIGPILDLERVQISAHVSNEDAAAHVPDAPAPSGRRWARVALQPRAAQIAAAFINNQKG